MKATLYGWAAYNTVNGKEILMDEQYGIRTFEHAVTLAKEWCEDTGFDYDTTMYIYVSRDGGPYNLCDDNGEEVFDD